MPTPESIPLTAWEQGAMVVLFALVFGGMIVMLLGWFTRQQRSWQAFIASRDETWQKFLKEQREVDNKTVRDLVAQVKDLTVQMVALRDDFNEHNTWERTKLDEMTRQRRQRGG